jgi:hypothetical protein
MEALYGCAIVTVVRLINACFFITLLLSPPQKNAGTAASIDNLVKFNNHYRNKTKMYYN